MSKQSKYKKMDPIEHVLARPDMYVGSIALEESQEYVVVDNEFHIEKKNISTSPAIIRIFVECISNAIDNVARSKNTVPCTRITVSVNEETGETSILNDGEIIPIEMHPEEKCYNHTLIFGHLLTGSNYDDKEDRYDISGKNGLGGKVVSIFSNTFRVEGVDPEKKLYFSQIWKNHMKTAEEPEVRSSKASKGYTKITYTPDFSLFGLEGYTEDIISCYKRLVVDCAMLTKVNVSFNDIKIPVKSLIDYSSLFQINEEIISTLEDDEPPKKKSSVLIKTSDCEVVLTPSNGVFEAISFANGIYTPEGGVHVDAWTEALFRPICEKFNKPKSPALTISDIKSFFRVFVVATVKQPGFNGQTKTMLKSPKVKAEVKISIIKNILKWDVIEKLNDIIRMKELSVLKKVERKRGHKKVDKLDPANNEGGSKGHLCTLIFVEGGSAKAFAVEGIQYGVFGKVGRDWNGIFELTGKMLNCRKAKAKSIADNKVVTSIIQALGLKYDTDYTNDEEFKKLRYGRILIMTDADVDGIHISALLQNMFHALFPTILNRDPPYINSLQTPIVRVNLKNETLWFYSEELFRTFVKLNKNKKYTKKYYKGLGTFTNKDAPAVFGKKYIEFINDEKTTDTMNKVFQKETLSRKDWMEGFDPNKTVLLWEGNEEETLRVGFSDFLDVEFIKYSISNCRRSIPSMVDGLKESQRKVLYTCISTNIKDEIKVSQLAGRVSEKTDYHHGEKSLEDAIVNLASVFVGSNNIPLLADDGQFGTREQGGKDSASARYIFTRLSTLARLIFRKEDDCLLSYIETDGIKIEPEYYVPIIPMILVNGAEGIATGWSCTVPSFNPKDLIGCIKIWLDNNSYHSETFPDIKPWYRGFLGKVEKLEETKFLISGVHNQEGKKTRVTELPVGLWTENFKEYLETLKEEKSITDYKNYSNTTKIDFLITENSDGIKCNESTLKLQKTVRTTNMILFDREEKLKKYNKLENVLEEYCSVRFDYYIKRKVLRLKELEKELVISENKYRFLCEVRDGEIKLFEEKGKIHQSRTAEDIISELEDKKYQKVEDSYDYLLHLQIGSITAKKIEKLVEDIKDTKQELKKLKNTSEKELWEGELKEFENAYENWLNEGKESGSKKKKAKK